MVPQGYGFAHVAPYVGMAAATMTTLGTSAVSLGRYGLNQAFDAATAPRARATISAVASAALVSLAKDYYYGMSDIKKKFIRYEVCFRPLTATFSKNEGIKPHR